MLQHPVAFLVSLPHVHCFRFSRCFRRPWPVRCQASDAEGTIRVLNAMLTEATTPPPPPPPPPAQTTTVPAFNPSPADTPTTCPTGSPDGSIRHPATPSAQQQQQQYQQQQQHLLGAGDGYPLAGGGHAHFVVAHPRTRWGVDALVPLLRESPGLSFICEEVSDPELVAGLEEASYLAWLHVHVWRDATPAAGGDGGGGDGFGGDGGEDVQIATEAIDEALLVVG